MAAVLQPVRAERSVTMANKAPMPQPGILDINPYVPGESNVAGGVKPIKLSSNETPLGPSPKAIAAFKAEAGVKAGLAPDLAHKLARWTVSGSGELLHCCDLPADVLRQNVTSPNGTTFAALQVLMADDGLAKLMREAVAAATKRSRELAQ